MNRRSNLLTACYTTERCWQFWDCLSFFVFLKVHNGFISQSLWLLFVTTPYLTFRSVVRFIFWSVPLQRLPKIRRRLKTKGVLRCIRAINTVFKKCKNDHALNLSQLQIPKLTLNHITRLGMSRGIPSLTGGCPKPEHRFQRCVWGKYEFWPRNKFGGTRPVRP
jgi:hypothetical protein